ncbi:unnamed protein product [Strongylus vulgaris]|uniref:MI domain-containing protein n=1 Tax=Strongylus vulgaris TaxID=40348 RepID=A0A3P7LAZ3_STRVU|nr:unnamed protein product [Strongylus vulgaris]
MWVIGSSYRVAHEADSVSTRTVNNKDAHSFPEPIVQLAKRAKMNTDVRRNVFCTIAISDDEDSAFEGLLRLSLRGQQEREIIYVLIIMMLKEKASNPFYPTLIARFCDFDKRFIVSLSFLFYEAFFRFLTIFIWVVSILPFTFPVKPLSSLFIQLRQF